MLHECSFFLQPLVSEGSNVQCVTQAVSGEQLGTVAGEGQLPQLRQMLQQGADATHANHKVNSNQEHSSMSLLPICFAEAQLVATGHAGLDSSALLCWRKEHSNESQLQQAPLHRHHQRAASGWGQH